MPNNEPSPDVRGSACPLCGGETSQLLSFTFGKKLDLPTQPELRVCTADDFAFLTKTAQTAYDRYYQSVVNDYRHREFSSSENTPLTLQITTMLSALDGFFDKPRSVLDFGCGEANLLTSLAGLFPNSKFEGYDPSPSIAKADKQTPTNLQVHGDFSVVADRRYDLIIASHVLEHLVDLSSLVQFNRLLRDDGTLYVEVPDALRYADYQRRSFLYYFDRLHVNHFSDTALKTLLAGCGFNASRTIRYHFPYADGGPYPALGMLFKKNDVTQAPETSVALGPLLERYIASEQERALHTAKALNAYDGSLVWGGGDNFYRSFCNGGPLTHVPNIKLLDKSERNIAVGTRQFQALNPEAAIRQCGYPVAITVSESTDEITRKISTYDPSRKIFFL
jgi:ubiquinone/menaquinone biosynthesis C-methylase UbiE